MKAGKIEIKDLLDSKFTPKRLAFSLNKYNQVVVETLRRSLSSRRMSDGEGSNGGDDSNLCHSETADNLLLKDNKCITSVCVEEGNVTGNNNSVTMVNKVDEKPCTLDSIELSNMEKTVEMTKSSPIDVQSNSKLKIDVDVASNHDTDEYAHDSRDCSPDRVPRPDASTKNDKIKRKKNVFAIMQTMQAEYIINGDHIDNLYSPRKAASALMRPHNFDYDDNIDAVRSHRFAGVRRRASGASVGSTGSFKRRSSRSNNVDSPVEEVPPSRPTGLTHSRSMELPKRILTPFKSRLMSSPNSALQISAADMHRRRESLEATSPNIHLTKFYKTDINLYEPRRQSPFQKGSGGVGEGDENMTTDLPPLTTLQNEKAKQHLSEMRNDFKRRKSSFTIRDRPSLPSAASQLFIVIDGEDGDPSLDTTSSKGIRPTLDQEAMSNVELVLLGKTVFGISKNSYNSILSIVKSPTFAIFSTWILWIIIGAIILVALQPQGMSFSCSFFVSVSVGIGMYWMHGSTCNLENNAGTKAFSLGKYFNIIFHCL